MTASPPSDSNPYIEQPLTRSEVDALEGTTVLDFGTNWCGHCNAARPGVDLVLARHDALRHLRIEDGPGRRLGRSFGVKLWPTLILIRRGAELARVVRPRSTDDIVRLVAAAEADQ